MAADKIKYNPKTGKKLKKGETVKSDGYTLKEGESFSKTLASQGGSKSSLAPKTSTTVKKTSSPIAPKPVATPKKTTPAVSPLSTATKKDALSSTGANVISYKAPTTKGVTFANPFTQGLGGFLKNAAQGWGSLFGGATKVAKNVAGTIANAGKQVALEGMANVLNATGRSALPENYGESSQLKGDDLVQFNDPSYYNAFDFNNPLNPIIGGGNIANAEEGYGANADGPTALSAGQFMEQKPTPSNPTGSSTGGTNTNEPDPIVDPNIDPKITPEITPLDTGAGGVVANPYAGLGLKFDELNMGLNGNSVNDKTAWMSPGSKSEFQTAQTINYANNAAKMFTSPEQAAQYFASPEGQLKTKDYIAKGGKIQDIISKVQTVTNGLTPAQTTAEYLSGGQPSLAQEKKAMNDMIATEYNFTQKQKDILFGAPGQLGIVEQQKLDAEARKDYYDRMLEMQEKSLKDKARLEIDKAEAEWEAKDAEVEMARLNAKSNLTEFLAKIGALRTDGNALLGIEKLEQAYQAQRQALRQNFQFAKRQIQGEMDDKIFNLEMDVEDKKFKLSQDLSKTEREIALEGMKLDYNFQKTMNEYKLKWADSIKTERERLERKAESAAEASNTQWLSLVGMGIDPAMIPGMLNGKGKVIMNETNAGIIQGAKTKLPETTPDYKGETLTLSTKVAKKIMDDTGMSNGDLVSLQNDLNAGWSLEQIAKNTGMPTTVFNILRQYVPKL